MRHRVMSNHGLMLITSYMVLSLFIVYASSTVLQTMSQRMATERMRANLQGLTLAQGAVEQLRQDLYRFLTVQVYQLANQGNAIKAMSWLDALGQNVAGKVAEDEVPLFEIGEINADRDGVLGNEREIELPSGSARAWIVSICVHPKDEGRVSDCIPDSNPLAPRLVSLRSIANTGSTIKTIQATYEVELGMSSIFRYAYFVNNFGWFHAPQNSIMLVNGEVRSNGDMSLSGPEVDERGQISNLYINGDVYASNNRKLLHPQTLQPAQGFISGDANQLSQLGYFQNHGFSQRPARRLTFPDQPAIEGSSPVLPYGQGWDTDYREGGVLEQREFSGQLPQPIPYVGDLELYKDTARKYQSPRVREQIKETRQTLKFLEKRREYLDKLVQRFPSLKKNIATQIQRLNEVNQRLTQWLDVYQQSSLKYYEPGPDGEYGSRDDVVKILKAVYAGPDGVSDSEDDAYPLVLVGTQQQPIEIYGPVVIPGDVIVKGVIKGRGTIYTGRNVHVVGETRYSDMPRWPALVRNEKNGYVKPRGASDKKIFGTICDNGKFYSLEESPPEECVAKEGNAHGRN